MIGKLRRKFIFILMSVVTLILLAVFVSILLSTAGNTRRMSENMLRQALAKPTYSQKMRPPQTGGGRNPSEAILPNPRMPVLVVEISPDGDLSFTDNQLHFIEEDQAIAAVQAALASGKNMGILNDYGLRFMLLDDGSRLALADYSFEQEMLKNLVFNSLMIGGAALTVFFFISMFLSRWAVRPVAQAWERQRQFVADASHELKTPLTVILSNADMLSGNGTFADEKKARRMEHIQAEAVRMKRLVEDLLMLAKSDITESTTIKERVDFSFVVKNAVLIFEPIVFDEKKKFTYDVQDNLFVEGDTQHLQQLVAILLDNAVKYCPAWGQVRLSLTEGDKKTALLVVSNDGAFIAKDELKKIFRRFYRLDQSRSAHGSFGLGLSIAESIVIEHGGKIWAENSAEKGNDFIVNLPLN